MSTDRTFNLQHVSNVTGTPVTTDTECLLQVCLGLVVRSPAAEAVGTWNAIFLLGEEPKLVCEAEKYQLKIVGLTSTHSLSSATRVLEMGQTLFHSGATLSESQQTGMGIPLFPVS